uniref:G-type lectin S-receptor-like serine/threonine-protein kinase SD2-5 n=1 Tax=Tanacetum cinerariifolium TaxID=118510 RepID=A0A699HEN7_TANCI|nr:G-type lectin S-receptor-like serine/threonine-protein kinase SD2-5 [Tanacetum cinerariifolium]
MTRTLGYLAPEWLSLVITKKVDVYIFGIVLLEMLCGRTDFYITQPEEKRNLLGMFQKCWEQGNLLDIVDGYSEDMKSHGTKVVEMIKLASWCLQTDYTRRPSMSSVVRVLKGGMNVELNLDYNFTDPRMHRAASEHEKDLT